MTRHNWNVVVGQQCGHTKQMVGVNVCEAGSHEHAKGKWWSNRLMSVSSCAGWRCYWCSLLAYLACQRDAPCGHRGSADSVGWQQSEGDRPASPTPGCFHWQPPPWAWPASGAWAHPWSGWLATVSPWGGRRKEVISQRAQWATIKILHFSKLTFEWAGKSLFFPPCVCVYIYMLCSDFYYKSLSACRYASSPLGSLCGACLIKNAVIFLFSFCLWNLSLPLLRALTEYLEVVLVVCIHGGVSWGCCWGAKKENKKWRHWKQLSFSITLMNIFALSLLFCRSNNELYWSLGHCVCACLFCVNKTFFFVFMFSDYAWHVFFIAYCANRIIMPSGGGLQITSTINSTAIISVYQQSNGYQSQSLSCKTEYNPKPSM